MESMHQPIIPGLPDDLALRCLAMLSHGYHGVIETVSKRWRDVIRSEEYSNYKAREGWCGDWLFVLTEGTPNQWIAYDPEANLWHPLPPTPDYELALSALFGCHCVYNKFLVIGGRYWELEAIQSPCTFVSDEVFQFDPFKKKWSTVTSMRTSRSCFASCTMDGKIYVAGGYNPDYWEGMKLAEVYDPLTDKWEDLPPMPVAMANCTGIAYKGKFHVINVYVDDQGLNKIEVFDPLSRSWHVKHESWFSRLNQVAFSDDQVYTLNELGGSRVERRDAEKDEWHIVGEVPLPFDPNDSKEHEVLYYGLAALGHELYVIGGRDYTIDDLENEEGDGLDRVMVCDPRCSPLIWRETRPMCLNASGSIKGWASLKQQ